MSRLTRDETAEPVSRDEILRHARGQGNINFPCSAEHEQDWQPYPVDPYSAICDDHTYIHTFMSRLRYFFVSQMSILSIAPFSIAGMGKEKDKKNVHGVTKIGSTRYVICLRDYWPCVGGPSAVNAIGTHLRDPIPSGLRMIDGRGRGKREESCE